MKGNADVLALLNDLLANELTAINQYLAQAEMCADWGYERLAARFRDDSADERGHADLLIQRILFLEGVPNMARYNPLNIGGTVREQIENDLKLEHAAIAFLNKSIAAARTAGDNGTEDLMTTILNAEEGDADWLEKQLELIRQLGEQNYLAQQLH